MDHRLHDLGLGIRSPGDLESLENGHFLIQQTIFKVFSSNICHIAANDNTFADSRGIMTLTLAKACKVNLNLIIRIPFSMEIVHTRVLCVTRSNGKAMYEDEHDL